MISRAQGLTAASSVHPENIVMAYFITYFYLGIIDHCILLSLSCHVEIVTFVGCYETMLHCKAKWCSGQLTHL